MESSSPFLVEERAHRVVKGFKEGVPSHCTDLGFTSSNLMGGFKEGFPIHGTYLDFTSLSWLKLADVVRFPSAFEPWCACHFVCFIRKRERETKALGVPGVSPIPSTQLPIQTGVGAPTAAGGDGTWSLCGPPLV